MARAPTRSAGSAASSSTVACRRSSVPLATIPTRRTARPQTRPPQPAVEDGEIGIDELQPRRERGVFEVVLSEVGDADVEVEIGTVARKDRGVEPDPRRRADLHVLRVQADVLEHEAPGTVVDHDGAVAHVAERDADDPLERDARRPPALLALAVPPSSASGDGTSPRLSTFQRPSPSRTSVRRGRSSTTPDASMAPCTSGQARTAMTTPSATRNGSAPNFGSSPIVTSRRRTPSGHHDGTTSPTTIGRPITCSTRATRRSRWTLIKARD